MRTAVYIAHPLSAPTREGVEANRANASLWFAWAERLGFVPMAGWITLTGILDETPDNRARGLEYDKAQLERCDVMWLVGGRVSSGMQIEREHAVACGIPVIDLTALGVSPPDPEWVDVEGMLRAPRRTEDPGYAVFRRLHAASHQISAMGYVDSLQALGFCSIAVSMVASCPNPEIKAALSELLTGDSAERAQAMLRGAAKA